MNTARQLMERRKSYGKVQRRAVSPAPQKQSSAKKPAKPAAKKPQPNANPSSQLKGGVNKKLKKSAATPEASSPKKPAHGPSSVVMQDGPESPPPLLRCEGNRAEAHVAEDVAAEAAKASLRVRRG